MTAAAAAAALAAAGTGVALNTNRIIVAFWLFSRPLDHWQEEKNQFPAGDEEIITIQMGYLGWDGCVVRPTEWSVG